MFPLSHARLPTRWRLALSRARRGAFATRATFTTTTATAFSLHPTTTRLQWQTSAVTSQPSPGVPASFRSFSHTARWQEFEKGADEKVKARKATKKKAAKEAKGKAAKEAKGKAAKEAKGKSQHAVGKQSGISVSEPSEVEEPAKVEEPKQQEESYEPEELDKPEESDKPGSPRKPEAGPKLAVRKGKNKRADKHDAGKKPEVFVLSPSEVERLEKEVLEEIEAKKVKKATKKQDKNVVVKKPPITPFGPFEDVIQPIALTLWGGKGEAFQNPPKLKYTMHFLGPTCFWRVQIRSTWPISDNDLWKVLWNGTRPKQDDKGSSGGKLAEKDEIESQKAPPLEAVVQDVVNRKLARLAYEKASQQKALEARQREKQLQHKKEREEPPTSIPINFTYQDPHKNRLPFQARNHMRHFDICGPLPNDLRDMKEKGSHIWTDIGGNVLANTFELEKISTTVLGNGINIWVWRGDYEIREMEAFLSPARRARLERIKQEEKLIRNWVLGRKGPPPKSSFVRKNDKERLRQLVRKSHVLRVHDGGWRKILEVVQRKIQRETHDESLKLPKKGADSTIAFTDENPHPDRATIEEVWEPLVYALRQADAIADYNAFLRRRMQEGIIPDKTDPKDFIAGQIKRGWMTPTQRKGEHPGDVAKRERRAKRDAELQAQDWQTEDSHARAPSGRRVVGSDKGNDGNGDGDGDGDGDVAPKPAASKPNSPRPLVRNIMIDVPEPKNPVVAAGFRPHEGKLAAAHEHEKLKAQRAAWEENLAKAAERRRRWEEMTGKKAEVSELERKLNRETAERRRRHAELTGKAPKLSEREKRTGAVIDMAEGREEK